MTSTRFAARCPSCAEHSDEILFADGAEWERHRRTVHAAETREHERNRKRDFQNAHRFLPFRPRRTKIPFREYKPKPFDAGQRIEFTQDVSSTSCREIVTREGVIWSDGPRPHSVWVLPDDAPTEPVAVTTSPRGGGLPDVLPGLSPEWQRDTMRRCENVRRHGGVFAVNQQRATHSRDQWVIVWHTWADCPFAIGKAPAMTRDFAAEYRATWSREPDGERWTELPSKPWREVVGILLTGAAYSQQLGTCCRRCFWLDDAAEAAVEAAA